MLVGKSAEAVVGETAEGPKGRIQTLQVEGAYFFDSDGSSRGKP